MQSVSRYSRYCRIVASRVWQRPQWAFCDSVPLVLSHCQSQLALRLLSTTTTRTKATRTTTRNLAAGSAQTRSNSKNKVRSKGSVTANQAAVKGRHKNATRSPAAGSAPRNTSKDHGRSKGSVTMNQAAVKGRHNEAPTRTTTRSPAAGTAPSSNSKTTRTTSRPAAGKAPSRTSNKNDRSKGVMIVNQAAIKGRHKAGSDAWCTGCGVHVHFISQVDALTDQQKYSYTGEPVVHYSSISGKKQLQPRLLDYADVWKQRGIQNNHSKNGVFVCERCLDLRQHENQRQHQQQSTDSESSAVQNADNLWRTHNVMDDIDSSVFVDQLQRRFHRFRALCLMVVDCTDSEHTAIKNLRKIVQWQPVWLVFNKMDLLPRLSPQDQHRLRQRIQTICGKVSFEQHFAVSSKTGRGVHRLAESLLQKLGGRDVYVVGTANVGKSTLVQQLTSRIAGAVYMQDRSFTERRSVLLQQLEVTQSHLPGTTLQSLRIACFRSPNHALWDTPGIMQRKALQYSIFPSYIMEPLTRPTAIPIPDHTRHGQIAKGMSILVEATWMEHDGDDNDGSARCCLGRIDVVDLDHGDSIFAQAYLHPDLKVRVVPRFLAPDHAIIPEKFLRRVQGGGSSSSSSSTSEKFNRPLQCFMTPDNPLGHAIPTDKMRRNDKYFMDVVFCSLGWISFTHESKFALKPHCVLGSVYSHRPSLYPVHLFDQIRNGDCEDEQDEDNTLTPEERKRQLNAASREGRHAANNLNGRPQGEEEEEEDWDETDDLIPNWEEDEWIP